MQAQNTGSPSAINDILNNPRFQGAIDSIGGVTQFFDSLFVSFISLIAFFIISAALLRNVIAGAYASYPKFFDMVAESKEAAISKVSGTRIGMIASFFLRIIPDFKALSDFHDNNVEPKTYFMKAIPQMVGVVMIGVVIYNGYYRDAVSLTAGFGSEIISRVLLNVDPVAVFDRLAATSGDPDFASNLDDSDRGNLVNKLTKDVYGKVVTHYTDIQGEQTKISLGSSVEEWVTGQLKGVDPKYFNTEAYEVKRQVSRVLGDPNLSGINASDSDLIKTYGFKSAMKNFDFSSTKYPGEDWWVRVVVRFTKIAEEKPTAGKSSNTTLSIPSSYLANINSNKDVKITFPSGGNGAKFTTAGAATINGKKIAITNGNTITISGATISSLGSGELTTVGLFYTVDTNKSSDIRKIKLNSGKSILFVDNTGKYNNFGWGDIPTTKAVKE